MPTKETKNNTYDLKDINLQRLYRLGANMLASVLGLRFDPW